ncbi:MAG TPA: DNA polymerase/3'-5' exonuclease PolX [Opitutaceae bacterium]
MSKKEIAQVLEEIGVLLELQGENPFKVRAYQAGARVLEGMEEAVLDQLVTAGELQSVKGIGEALAQKITELRTTGRLVFYEKQRAAVEPGLVEMLQIPGLGPKKIRAIRDKLGIADIAALTAACQDGRVAALDGFGEKTQEKILTGIRNREAYSRRHLWWDAEETAEPILKGLREHPKVKRAESAGSLRRGLETVGDLDFLAAAPLADAAAIMDWFAGLPGVKEVTGRGETKASVRFDTGLQADLRVLPEDQFAFALHHFTGSKDHNVQMRQRALARGLSLSEWGLAPAEGEGRVKEKVAAVPAPPTIRTEEQLFGALGLPFIPPELREGRGEIEAAEAGQLPKLIEHRDLRGAFHNHTTASDGHNTLAEMAAAAAVLGWEYLGIADHSKSSVQARGLTEERLAGQIKQIADYNAGPDAALRVLTGVECDILPDGRLDFDDAVLASLDYAVASVHSVLGQDRAVMTARVLRAIEHPRTTILGHATGRLLLRRESSRIDLDKVIDAAIAHGVAIELNASPERLELDWRHWRKAAERGLRCTINPDAHETASLGYVRAGINIARKGWLTAGDVINTRPLGEILAWLAQRKSRT